MHMHNSKMGNGLISELHRNNMKVFKLLARIVITDWGKIWYTAYVHIYVLGYLPIHSPQFIHHILNRSNILNKNDFTFFVVKSMVIILNWKGPVNYSKENWLQRE